MTVLCQRIGSHKIKWILIDTEGVKDVQFFWVISVLYFNCTCCRVNIASWM